jgi:triosephosphate isomerase
MEQIRMAKQIVRPCVIAGNWKMNKTITEATRFIDEFLPLIEKSTTQIYLAVPFTSIQPVVEKVKGSSVIVGAQNMNDASEGAFTGEIAAIMIKEVGAQFVILGHSERRHIFGETNEFINRKVKRAYADGLQPIVCIGETREQHEAGQTQQVLTQQLKESLAGVNAAQMQKTIIAYEPVWAIGTGITPTPEQAQEVHAFCRQVVLDNWTDKTSLSVVLLYGGSVKPDNTKLFMEQTDIDGVLVGGASLSPISFAQIVNYQNATVKG